MLLAIFLFARLLAHQSHLLFCNILTKVIQVSIFRTLVVPVFFAHRTHPGNLSPSQFIDVERVCRFVSCMSVEDLQMKCNNSFDVALEVSNNDDDPIEQAKSKI